MIALPGVGDNVGNGQGITSPLPDDILSRSNGQLRGKLLPDERSLLGGWAPWVLGSPVQVMLINLDVLEGERCG